MLGALSAWWNGPSLSEGQDSTKSSGMEQALQANAALGTMLFKVPSSCCTVGSFLDREDTVCITRTERTSLEFEASDMVARSFSCIGPSPPQRNDSPGFTGLTQARLEVEVSGTVAIGIVSCCTGTSLQERVDSTTLGMEEASPAAAVSWTVVV